MQVTIKQATKLRDVVSHGLCSGVGIPKPGEMCVMAAICYALDLPHGDNPETCVDRNVRSYDIKINDANWSSRKARGEGMMREAIAKLGSAGVIDSQKFVSRLAEETIKRVIPIALRSAAKVQKALKHRDALIQAADRCEQEGSHAAADAAANAATYAAASAAAYAAKAAYAAADATYAATYAAAYAAASAAAYAATYAANAATYAAADAAAYAASAAAYADKVLATACEMVVEILTELGSPGVQFLEDLAPNKPTPYKVEM